MADEKSPPEPSARPRFQIHLTTILLQVFVIAVFMWINADPQPQRRSVGPQSKCYRPGHNHYVIENVYGIPYPVVRVVVYSTTDSVPVGTIALEKGAARAAAINGLIPFCVMVLFTICAEPQLVARQGKRAEPRWLAQLRKGKRCLGGAIPVPDARSAERR